MRIFYVSNKTTFHRLNKRFYYFLRNNKEVESERVMIFCRI